MRQFRIIRAVKVLNSNGPLILGPSGFWTCLCLRNPTRFSPELLAGLRKVMVRAHRQAWCWQDEWYGLTIEDIRQLELETQLALAKKMAQYSLSEEGGAETNGSSVSQDQDRGSEPAGSAADAEGGAAPGESAETRGELTKQWSTSSRSSNRSSKRGGEAGQNHEVLFSLTPSMIQPVLRTPDSPGPEEGKGPF